jgi:hypothetical protein
VAKEPNSTGQKVVYVLAVVVGGVWAGTTIVDMFNPSYNPPDSAGAAFMAVLGVLLGIITTREAKKKSGNDDEGEE